MLNLWEVVNEALITLVVALIGLMVWYLRAWLQQRLNAEQLQMVNWVAATAVKAAEAYGGEAEEKKRTAVGLAQTWLHDHNIKLDLHSLDAAIEAAVFSELNRFPKMEEIIDIDLSGLASGASSENPEVSE